jgi:hypothetical protein
MTREEVRELFDYNPDDGLLRWRKGRRAGCVAGTPNSGGRLTVWAGEKYKQHYVHRLIWLWVYGVWPSEMDHVNLNRTDNRLANLRLCTASQSAANRRGWAKSGFKGVHQRGKKWAAYITKNGVKCYIGIYFTPGLANAAFLEAAKSIHGAFARGM